MTTREEVRGKVRRRVADFDDPYKYKNVYYDDAIDFGLQKLSHDLGEDYATVPVVPFKHIFLLVKLASIEMCYVRAAEANAVDSDSEDAGDITSISVPDLSLSSNVDPASATSSTWMTLAQQLQDEYDDEIEKGGGNQNSAEIQVGHLKAISLTNGGYIKRKLDRGPDATTVTATITGSDVKLEWEIWYNERFKSYRVERSATPEFEEDNPQIQVIVDNHKNEYKDSGRPAGTYYYRVVTVCYNELKAYSNVLEVVIV